MDQVFLFVILVLASYRLTRLITTDEWPPSRWFRDKVVARYGPQSTPAYLVTCPWCMGAWVAALVVLATSLWRPVPLPVLWWAAISSLVGLMAEWWEDD